MSIHFSRANISKERAELLKRAFDEDRKRCPHSMDKRLTMRDVVIRLVECEGLEVGRRKECHPMDFDYEVVSSSSGQYFDRITIHESLHEGHPHTPLDTITTALTRFVKRGVNRLIVVTETNQFHGRWIGEGRDFGILVEPRSVSEIYAWIDSLISGDRAKEQMLAEITYDFSRKVVEMIAFDHRTLDRVEWRDLERALAECFSGCGFQAELTPSSKDGGKDLIIRALHDGSYRYFNVELKHWVSGKRVGKETIDRFLRVGVSDRVDGGVFISTSGYTRNVLDVLTYVQMENVALSGRDELTRLCRSYVRSEGGIWTCPTNFIANLWTNDLKRL